MRDFWMSFKQNKVAVFSGGVIFVFSIFALFAPWIAPFTATDMFSESLKTPPLWSGEGNSRFPLGTDDLGRDLFSRLVLGARVSLSIGFFVVIFSVSIGSFLGLLAGSLQGWVDTVIMRVTDVIMSLPSLLLAIVVVAILGPNIVTTIVAVGVVLVPHFVRIVRATVMAEMKKNYVLAARSFGASWFRIVIINVLPNCLAPLIVQATLTFSDGILNAAALGFLGLGAQPPIPEWGTMLADSRQFIETSPYLVTLPGLCILIVVLAFNLFGDGLRDALDPKLRR